MNPLHKRAAFDEPIVNRRPDGDRLERGAEGTTQVRTEKGIFSATREEKAVVIEITGQTKADAQDPHSHFFMSIFVESALRPDVKQALHELKMHYGEDFEESTISIKELRGCNAETMRKGGLPVNKI